MNSYRDSHIGKGAEYHVTFIENASRYVMWELEKGILDKILSSCTRLDDKKYLDFACGTGRIVGYVGRRFSCAIGMDISASMLEVAMKQSPFATFVQGDITCDDLLDQERFDVITAFRFFPNAEPALRANVMERLARRLKPGGRLIINNHKNEGSLLLRVARIFGKGDPNNMTSLEMEELISSCHLTIESRYPIGILNWTDTLTVRPRSLAVRLERALTRVTTLNSLAQNVVFVCVKPAEECQEK